MKGARFLTIAEQVAEHLRGEMLGGRWRGMLPGLPSLTAELGVNVKTVETALRLLEKDGLLVPRGPGRRRLIHLPEGHLPEGGRKSRGLRIGFLLSERSDLKKDYQVEIRHRLGEAGHTVVYPPNSMEDLGMNVKRIVRMVEKTEADAWVVTAGSRELMEWFSTRNVPVLALFGRRRGLPMASVGPDKPSAYAEATRTLIGHGHRRIVLLARKGRRLPQPGGSEQAFLDELAAHGISAGSYHLPDWEENIGGFGARLDSLFGHTPPTALILDEAPLLVATLEFCANRGLRVPQDISLVSTDADPAFDWCQLAISHIRWDSAPVVRRIERWAANVSRGRKDVRQTLTPAEFVPGGTIGPAKSR